MSKNDHDDTRRCACLLQYSVPSTGTEKTTRTTLSQSPRIISSVDILLFPSRLGSLVASLGKVSLLLLYPKWISRRMSTSARWAGA